MRHLWTLIFITLLAIGFGITAWKDHQDKKRRERRTISYQAKQPPKS